MTVIEQDIPRGAHLYELYDGSQDVGMIVGGIAETEVKHFYEDVEKSDYPNEDLVRLEGKVALDGSAINLPSDSNHESPFAA